MDACGVDVGVIAAGIAAEETDAAARRGGRPSGPPARRARSSTGPTGRCARCTRLRALAAHPAVALVRVTPLVHQYPLNDKLYYPVYATCAELGLPVSINVGIPGPRVRSACQHPELLEDVLIDFKGLTVIGAHMGHPYEALLMQYMLKWPDLYLSNSAYLAKYMDPALVSFMDSTRGLGRVLFASDHPFLPMERAVAAARDLPLSDAAAAGLSRRHGHPPAPPRLSAERPDAYGGTRWYGASVDLGRIGVWWSGSWRDARRSGPRASPPSSSPSATGRCGRRAASTPGCRRTSSGCSPPRTTCAVASGIVSIWARRARGRRAGRRRARGPRSRGASCSASAPATRRWSADYARPYSQDGGLPRRARRPAPTPGAARAAACWPRSGPACSSWPPPAPPAPTRTSSRSSTRRAPGDILGPGPLLAPEVAVVLETDPTRARELARGYASTLPRPAQLHARTCAPSASATTTSTAAGATG